MALRPKPAQITLCIALFISVLFPSGRMLGQSTSGQAATPQASTSKSPDDSQQAPLPPAEQPGVPAPGKTVQGEDKRVFGVLPNYRTAEMSAEYTPISTKRKLFIATKDSFDYPLMVLAAGYAGIYQLKNSHPEFGQGTKGYLRRFGTGMADQAIGNFMTEGFMPIVFHEDPRYFRMNEGPFKKRLGYAISRIVVTKTDSGHKSFNFAEIVGNGIGAGIGLSYYPDNRDLPDYIQNWGIALATDASSQMLKEFWPDVKRWLYNKHHKG